jgi:hypothetical protein
VFIESCKSFERRLDVFSGYISHVFCLEYSNKPPIRVGVVEK